MHDHSEILALAAASIDFELSPAERSQLDQALEACSLCRRQASAMRATATILRRPSDIGTPSRVRAVVVGAAMRGGRRSPRFGPLLVASLSLLVVLGGTAVIVGSRGFGIVAPVSSPSPVPVQSASAAATATPLPTPEPDPTPTPSPTIAAVPPSPTVDGPLQAGDIAAMVTDGRLVIRTLPQATADSAIFKTRLHPGQRVLLLEGPVEGSGYPWFRVRVGALEGWVAAASRDGEPWLAPVRNGVIAFVREDPDSLAAAIYTRTPDAAAGEALLLADPDLQNLGHLAWSQDGRRLAFVATPADSKNGTSEVFVVDADGSNLVRVTVNEVDDDSPAWSPDGTRLAVRVGQLDPAAPGDSDVVVTPVDGPGITVLGPGANPVWSPDGLQLAMTVTEAGSASVWVQAPDGGGRRQVTNVAIVPAPPAWSPDGQQLLVSSSGLVLVDVASGTITPLTDEPATLSAWAIRGAIALSTKSSPLPGIFVIGPDGSGLRRVWNDPSEAITPQWSPDGRRLLLSADGNTSQMSVVDASGGDLTFVEGRVYVVASGDTLSRIASEHSLTVDQLLAANPQVTDPDRFAIGDEIVIPTLGVIDRSPAWQPRLP